LPALVFWRSKRLLFIGATMLLVPLIYWTPLKMVFSKAFSGVFTDRLLANTSLYFLVFGLVLGLIFYFKDRFFSKLNKILGYLIFGLMICFGFLIVILENRHHLVSDFIYKILYAKTTNAWLNHYYWWFLAGVSIIAAIFFIILLKKKMENIDPEYKNHLFAFILMMILAYVLISPSIVNVQYQLKQPKNLTGEAYFLYLINNDQNALAFLKTQVPAKSVILASANASKGLSSLIDQYLVYNPGSAYEKKFDWVFDGGNPDAEKADIVTSSKWAIDYIYLANPAAEDQHFRGHPELYQKIYDSQTKIYQVIK
jgi:hypothetical protein